MGVSSTEVAYRPRLVDALFADAMEAFPAVMVVGPRAGSTPSTQAPPRQPRHPTHVERRASTSTTKPHRVRRLTRERHYEDLSSEAVDWETSPLGKVWVHLVAAHDWERFTGEPAPASPISVDHYVEAGLPWFDYVNPTGVDVGATAVMADLKSIGELSGAEEHLPVVSPDDSVVRTIVGSRNGRVAQGEWTWTGRGS